VVLSRQLGLELSVNVTQHECAGIHCITHTSDDALLVPYLHPALQPRHAMGIHGYETPPSPPQQQTTSLTLLPESSKTSVPASAYLSPSSAPTITPNILARFALRSISVSGSSRSNLAKADPTQPCEPSTTASYDSSVSTSIPSSYSMAPTSLYSNETKRSAALE
jgi:hypothetical protein